MFDVKERWLKVQSLPCWSCQQDVADHEFCQECGMIQPVSKKNAFEYFHLPAEFDLDLDDLNGIFIERQRIFHPDRFVRASHKAQQLSREHSAQINAAFAILENPIDRAEEILKIWGCPPAHQEGKSLQDPELLMEMMEMRESLENLKEPQEHENFIQQLHDCIQDCQDKISSYIHQHHVSHVQNHVLKLRYLTRMLEQARANIIH